MQLNIKRRGALGEMSCSLGRKINATCECLFPRDGISTTQWIEGELPS